MMPTTSVIALACPVVWLSIRWCRYRQAVARINDYPGLRLMFGNTAFFSNVIPPIPYISVGRNHPWESKHSIFDRTNSGIYGVASVFPPISNLMVSDPEAIKQISYTRNGFDKHTDDYEMLSKFGTNLLVTKGEEWKRQRRICAPAFSDRNNRLVWSTATKYANEMLDTWDSRKPTSIHDVCKQVTLPLSICVISGAGFGQDTHWGDEMVPDGHQMSFKQALAMSSSNMHLLIVLPDWAWGLREHWRHVKAATDELKSYLHGMIRSHRELKAEQAHDLAEQKHDLLNQLIFARDENDSLTEEELIGNVFIFVVAGHESTAHTLAITLALLALYPETQDELVNQISEVQVQCGTLTYDHMHKLTYAMAVVYETLRLFPMVPMLPKQATSDTTLTVGHSPSTQKIQVPASTPAYILPAGVHYSPSYWDSPEDFVPARFMDPHWNRDAFVPFSVGPRACIGRRFAETTLVASLVTITSKYRVSIDESRFKALPGESILDRRMRLLKPSTLLTLTPLPIPLVFSPRE